MQPRSNTNPVRRVDKKLHGKVTRYPMTRVFHRARCRADTPLAHEPYQSAANVFPLEQHENHQQQHQGSGAERAQDRAKSLLH